MEKIDAVILGPKWQPAYTTCIASNKEQAINEAETDGADVIAVVIHCPNAYTVMPKKPKGNRELRRSAIAGQCIYA